MQPAVNGRLPPSRRACSASSASSRRADLDKLQAGHRRCRRPPRSCPPGSGRPWRRPALAPTSFCGMPPIGPTLPSSSIVPVPAMILPPVRSSGSQLVDDAQREHQAGATARRCCPSRILSVNGCGLLVLARSTPDPRRLPVVALGGDRGGAGLLVAGVADGQRGAGRLGPDQLGSFCRAGDRCPSTVVMMSSGRQHALRGDRPAVTVARPSPAPDSPARAARRSPRVVCDGWKSSAFCCVDLLLGLVRRVDQLRGHHRVVAVEPAAHRVEAGSVGLDARP